VSAAAKKRRSATAQHRPAKIKRRFKHDNPTGGDLFSGFGGLTQAIKSAGFETIVAANHNVYKTEVHERNHPEVEHWIADLVDKESGDYHDVRDLPAVDFLGAGVSCVNHSRGNSEKAYERGGTLFDLEDPEYDARVTRSERDRATANCVLHYAAVHHPDLILVECTTQLYSWGPLLPGSKKVGDGTTYRWWLKQFDLLGYNVQVVYLNSMFFGVGQARNRGFWAFSDKRLPLPDLQHRPESWCQRCDTIVEAVWTWRTGVPPSGTVDYGVQYDYRCPSCRRVVVPPFTPSLDAIDLTDLGTKIGEKPHKKHKDGSTGPLALATLARAERCRQRLGHFPAVLMPAKSIRGVERHPWQPMSTQTSQQETALLSTGALMAAAGNTYERDGSNCRVRDFSEPLPAQTATNGMGLITPPIAMAVANYQGAPRGTDEPLPTQVGSETLGMLAAAVLPLRTHATPRGLDEPMQTLVAGAGSGGISLVSAGVVPYRKHTTPSTHAEPMPTFTAEQVPGLLTAAGRVANYGGPRQAHGAHPLSDPLGTTTATDSQALLFSGWSDHAAAEWHRSLADLSLEECYWRMLGSHEVGRGCGFDVDFMDHKGTFIVWGSARDQIDGFGNAVTPAVGEWLAKRLRRVLHGEAAA
jgi:DNA (cytosine-5)-methyltransferase 1